MRRNRERLAWVVLLTSFFVCVGLAVAVPLGARYYVLYSQVGQQTVLEPLRETPNMQRGGLGDFIAVREPTNDVPPGTVVNTDAAEQGLLTLYPRSEESTAVAAIQMYGNTEMVLLSARSPRFSASSLPHRIALEVRRASLGPESQAPQGSQVEGRVRVNVAQAGGRSTVVELHTPHFSLSLKEGSYDVRVRETFSELAVREGRAQVAPVGGEPVVLGSSQRAIARPGLSSLEVLAGARNLLANGDFREPLEVDWEIDHDEDQEPPGTVEVGTFAGRRGVWFQRSGVGHAEVETSQEIDYDVRDFTSLVLNISVQVREQSLPGCGSLGSECPIIVRIDYKDIYGTDQEWYHGFYAREHDPIDRLLPWDEQIPPQIWYAFHSGNLMDPENEWALDESPALIKQVTIYASGHSFEALVTEVELLAQE